MSRVGAPGRDARHSQGQGLGVRPEALAAEWHRRAEALGCGSRARSRLLHRLPTRLLAPAELVRALAELLSADGLTATSSTFERAEAIRGWCVRLP